MKWPNSNISGLFQCLTKLFSSKRWGLFWEYSRMVQQFVRCLPNSILQSRESKSLRIKQAIYLFSRTTFLISFTHDPSSRKWSIGRTFLISTLFLKVQQHSIIRYYCLHGSSNQLIDTKLCRVYHEAVLCLWAVEKWAARFRGRQETVEDDSRHGLHPKNDLRDAVLRYLDK
jgi:hypothetical protein